MSPSGIRILDMGCGTGKQLAANHEQFPGHVMVGLDFFQGMLYQAQNRCQAIPWVQGNSARPPFKSDSFDYISNQFSYQHVLDKPDMIIETYRILRSGGRFVMTNVDPWSMPNWIIYQFFPAAQQRDLADFLPAEEFEAALREVGFSNIQLERQYFPVKEDLKRFLEYASQRFRTSQLMAIADDDYNEGLAAIKSMLQQRAEVDSDVCLVTISADKLPTISGIFGYT